MRPLHAFGFQLFERNHGVDQAHVERFRRSVLTAEIPYLARLLLADERCQIARAVPRIEAAHLRPCLAELSRLGCNGQVAEDMQHVPTADRITIHHSNDRLRHNANKTLQVKHVQARNIVFSHIPAIATNLLVASGAERFIFMTATMVGTRQNDDANLRVITCNGKGIVHLVHRQRRERVASLRAVDSNLCDTVVRFVHDLPISLARLPGKLLRLPHGASHLICFVPYAKRKAAKSTRPPESQSRPFYSALTASHCAKNGRTWSHSDAGCSRCGL